jgi:hypothetical protein
MGWFGRGSAPFTPCSGPKLLPKQVVTGGLLSG